MPFRAPGLLSTLCTAFYTLFGMLLRGGKTVEKREFCKILSLITVISTFKMLVTFHLSISFVVDVDLRSMWGLLPGFGMHCTVRDFRECFGKSLYGRNLLLTIQDLFLFFHGTSDSPPMKGYIPSLYHEYDEGS